MDFPFPKEMLERYKDSGLPPQGIGADMIADQWDLSREDLDAFGARSQQRAEQATADGRFKSEIVPVPVVDDEGVESMMHAREAGRIASRLQGGRQDHRGQQLADQRRRLGGPHHER
jgi:acetyl-CoA acyltransferase